MTERRETRLTGDGHPWVPGYVRDARLAAGGLLAGRQGVDDGRRGGCLVIELCGGRHGGGGGGDGGRGGRGGDQAARRSAVLMMMAEGVVDHRVRGGGRDVSGEAGGVAAGLVARRGVDGRGSGQRGAGGRGRAESRDHAGRGAERGRGDRLLLLMVMMRRRRRHVRVHARGACRRRGRRGAS